MINPEELAICQRRGHTGEIREGWTKCKWCGTWRREVRTVEEREDDPPEAELDTRLRTRNILDNI